MSSIKKIQININIACLGILLFLISCSSWENLEKASERSRETTNNDSTEPEVILLRLSSSAPGDGAMDADKYYCLHYIRHRNGCFYSDHKYLGYAV